MRRVIGKANLREAIKGMQRMFFFVAAACWIAAAIPAPALADESVCCPDHVWIACGEQIRQINGSLTQRYLLKSSEENRPPCFSGLSWEAYYRLYGGAVSEKRYRHVPMRCRDGEPYLDVNCRTNARLELIVVGRCGRRRFTAQTQHVVFGKASDGKQEQSLSLSELPSDLRRINLQPSRRNYYMQTGRAYRFAYQGNGGAVVSFEVLEEDRPLQLDLALAPDGTVAYAPAHDPRLDRNSPYEFKEVVMLAREVTGEREYATTFTMLLHRSYSAHLRRRPGLVVFAGAAALVAGLVAVLKGRPWYR